MGLAAALCIAIGVFPEPLYALLPHPVAFEPYSGVHVTESLGILMFTALGFVLFLKSLDPENTISIDTDWFYRRARGFHVARRESAGALREGGERGLRDRGAALPARGGTAGLRIDLHGVDAVVNGTPA